MDESRPSDNNTTDPPERIYPLYDTEQWKSEYQNQFTWKTPYDPVVKDIRSEAVQTNSEPKSIPLADVEQIVNEAYLASKPTEQPASLSSYENSNPQTSLNSKREKFDVSQTETIATDSESQSLSPLILPNPDPESLSVVSHVPHFAPDTHVYSSDVVPKKSVTIRTPNSKESSTNSQQQTLMVPYGSGNSHPIVPQNLFKTFNVKAPSTEVYPQTKERIERIKRYDEEYLKNAPDAKTERPRISNPAEALKQYLQARRQVEKLQLRFKSEYKREFLDWSKTVDRIVEAKDMTVDDLARSRTPSPTKPRRDYAAGLPSAFIEPVHQKKNTLDSQRDRDSLFTTTLQQPGSQKKDFFVESSHKVTDLNVRKAPSLGSQIHPQKKQQHARGRTLFQQILETPAAGIKDSEASVYRERRHFPVAKDSLQEQIEAAEHLAHSRTNTSHQEPYTVPVATQTASSEAGRPPVAPKQRFSEHMFSGYSGQVIRDAAEDSVKLPATWSLAQDILKRAKDRERTLSESQ